MTKNCSEDDSVIDLARDLADPAKKEQAAAAIWNRYHQRLESLIAVNLDQRLRIRVAASSVAQEAWRSLFSELEAGRGEFRDREGVFALLWKIARNKLISRVRHATAQGRDFAREEEAYEHEFEAKTVEPLAHLIADEVVTEAINSLDDELRSVFDLMLHDVGAKEIAQQLRISEPAARRRIERIRVRFSRLYNDED